MRALVSTKGMARDEWLKWRATGIGGSDVSVLFGVNRFRSIFDLWREKTGQKELAESSSEAAHFGTILEETVKREFMDRTGLKVRAKNVLLQSIKYPFMQANLDGIINENGEKVIFEAKTATEYKASEWEEGVPWEYQLQVQHYFAVTGYRKAYVAALVGGNKFFIHTLYSDEELIEKIIEVEARFWSVNVLGRISPLADGSKATTTFLNEKYANCNGSTIELPSSTLPILMKFEQVSKQLKELEEVKDSLGNQLKQYLGENEVGIIDDHRVSWKAVSRMGIDTKRLKAEKPEIYSAYIKDSSYRKLQVA